MTPYVSLHGCHGNQENTNLIFHPDFSMIEMLLFVIYGRCALKTSFKWGRRSFWNILAPNSTKLHVLVGNENQKHEK